MSLCPSIGSTIPWRLAMKTTLKTNTLFSLFFNKNNLHGFTTFGFFVRVFLYSGVFITLMLPSIDKFGGQNFFSKNESEVKNYLETFNRAQKAYQFEMGRFADSLSQLQVAIRYRSYHYHILSSMIPVVEASNNSKDSQFLQRTFTIAQPLPPYSNSLKSYIGAVFFDANNSIFITGICRMDQAKTLPTTVPTLNRDQTIQCPAGSTLVR